VDYNFHIAALIQKVLWPRYFPQMKLEVGPTTPTALNCVTVLSPALQNSPGAIAAAAGRLAQAELGDQVLRGAGRDPELVRDHPR
jgi:hypothetical protein